LTQAATPRPTATPAPYTPAPTPTPTITPTPIIYAIRGGDTLLAIAGQYHVSVQSLQQANGIADPGSLRVGQELVIPQPAPQNAESTPTAVATPMPFAVENVAFSRTPLDGLWCLGEIHNTTGVDLEQAAVTITLLDEAQKTLAQVQAVAALDLIPPGGRAPFAVRFAEPPATFATYLATASSGVRGYVGSYYRDLVVRDLQGEGERYTAYTLRGTVANTGPEDAVEVQVTVTLYDDLDRVIGTRRAAPEHNVIPRGGQTSFTLALTPSGGPVARYRAEALGRRMPTPTPVAAGSIGPSLALASNASSLFG
jgi:murein DD-endopeptidase MepM/ murein hydrolase activator NlpD